MTAYQGDYSTPIDPVKLDRLAQVAVKVGLRLQPGLDFDSVRNLDRGPQPHLRLVHMKDIPRENLIQEFLVACPVVACHHGLESVDFLSAHR